MDEFLLLFLKILLGLMAILSGGAAAYCFHKAGSETPEFMGPPSLLEQKWTNRLIVSATIGLVLAFLWLLTFV